MERETRDYLDKKFERVYDKIDELRSGTDAKIATVHKRVNSIEKEQGKVMGKLAIIVGAFSTLSAAVINYLFGNGAP